MQAQILRYIEEQFHLDAEQAEETWLRVEQDVSRFALDKELIVGDAEYLSLTKWYVKALLGEAVSPRAPIIKTFKEFLLEKYNEKF
jgi:hypothetical protein